MGFRTIVNTLQLSLTLEAPPAPAALTPGPAAPAPAPAPELGLEAPPAPAPSAPEASPATPWPAGLEAAGALAVAELGAMPAATRLGTLPVPFVVRCTHDTTVFYLTWHTSTHSYLLHQRKLVLDASEWDALSLGAHEGRAEHMPADWLAMKVRHAHRRITPELCMSGAMPDTRTRNLTVLQVCAEWGISLEGLAYGPT